MSVKKKTTKKKTIKNLKLEAAKASLTMPSIYDKRFKSSWEYLLGVPGAVPVERKQIVHIAKPKSKLTELNWAQISEVING